MTTAKPPAHRQRGRIEVLDSGSLRVSVFAGTDPFTCRRHYLTETVPLAKNAPAKAVKAAWKRAEQIKQDFIKQVDERRNPRTKATVDQLLDRMLDPGQTTLEWGRRTRTTNIGYIDKHVRPLIGRFQVGRLGADIFDPFYAELRRCRDHCDAKPYIQHRTNRRHDCDDRCGKHRCVPLAPATIIKIHNILSLGLKLAVRWKWITVNPISEAAPPKQPPPDPQPPSPADMARIITAAWELDPDFGLLVWLAARTGSRRGEICAWRLDLLDADNRVLDIQTSIGEDGGETWEQSTKTNRRRRVVLSQVDIDLIDAYLRRHHDEAATLGLTIDAAGRLFSPEPDHSRWYVPDSVSQRYDRLCTRLGIHTSLKQIRAFTATELITAGVDVRTVAGILGHGSGGVTTLRAYAAFVDEAAQRAADLTSTRMPELPAAAKRTLTGQAAPAVPDEPTSAYQRIAADIAGAIRCGIATPGTTLPSMKQLADRYDVNVQTVHRAIDLLKQDGLVHASRGVATTVSHDAGSN